MALEVPVVGEKVSAGDPKFITVATAAKEHLESYRMLLAASQWAVKDLAAGTYFMGLMDTTLSTPIKSASAFSFEGPVTPFPLIYFDDADYLVTGVTQKLRLRAQILCNATKAAIKFTFGLYPVTVAGTADSMTITLGTVVSGSTVEINEPAASTVSSGTGSDFTIPADGAYALGVVTSGTLTNNSATLLSAQLQTESV